MMISMPFWGHCETHKAAPAQQLFCFKPSVRWIYLEKRLAIICSLSFPRFNNLTLSFSTKASFCSCRQQSTATIKARRLNDERFNRQLSLRRNWNETLLKPPSFHIVLLSWQLVASVCSLVDTHAKLDVATCEFCPNYLRTMIVKKDFWQRRFLWLLIE